MNPRHFLAVCFAAVVVGIAPSAFAASANPLAAVRDLGVQIKNAADRASTGHALSSGDLSHFERRVDVLSVAQDNDPVFRQKLQSVARLLSNLKFATKHPTQLITHTPARADLDIEQVTAKHGDACASALGISNALPARLTLGATGNGSAWFRYEASADGHVRFVTDSSGADPALAVFSECTSGAVPIAQNDDAIGLDAATTVSVTAHDAIYVHLTNSGNGGPVTLNVANANATVTGIITDAVSGQPISGANIQLAGSGPTYTGISTTTDPTGSYSLSAPAGSYYVFAQAPSYLSQVYPAASCPFNTYAYSIANCNLSAAQLTALSSGVTTSGINMALSAGYVVAGKVLDDSNQSVAQAYVTLYDSNGNQLTAATADNFGRYSFATIPPGTYKLSAQATGYGSQIFDHVVCTGQFQNQCNLANATAIVISNQNISAANFNLPVLPAIAGVISGPGLQLGYYNNFINALDTFGNTVASASADQNGNYRIGPLAGGNYYVVANAPGFFSQIFSGIDCPQSCLSQTASATTVHVDMTTRLGHANFNMTPLPVVHGHVQDAVTGVPLTNVSIRASLTPPANFNAVGSAPTDGNGNYALTGVPAGQFYLWAESPDHIDQIYSGIPCETLPSGYATCSVTGAQLLTIAPGQTPANFNFSLYPASGISGRATTRDGSNSDLPAQTQISIYDDSGTLAATTNTDANGNYAAGDLAPGTYFVSAGLYYGYPSYVPQIWNMIDCPTACAPTTGTPVIVASQSTTSNIDFNLVAQNAIVGRVTDASSNPLPGIIIDLFDPITGNHLTSTATDGNGLYSVTWNSNATYYVATDSNGSHVDQVYSGISCPAGPAYLGLCPLTNATPVTVGSNVIQPVIVNFVLQPSDLIFANGFE
ncbi:MAG: MSCRAMM family protein [Rudaea sp.]